MSSTKATLKLRAGGAGGKQPGGPPTLVIKRKADEAQAEGDDGAEKKKKKKLKQPDASSTTPSQIKLAGSTIKVPKADAPAPVPVPPPGPGSSKPLRLSVPGGASSSEGGEKGDKKKVKVAPPKLKVPSVGTAGAAGSEAGTAAPKLKLKKKKTTEEDGGSAVTVGGAKVNGGGDRIKKRAAPSESPVPMEVTGSAAAAAAGPPPPLPPPLQASSSSGGRARGGGRRRVQVEEDEDDDDDDEVATATMDVVATEEEEEDKAAVLTRQEAAPQQPPPPPLAAGAATRGEEEQQEREGGGGEENEDEAKSVTTTTADKQKHKEKSSKEEEGGGNKVLAGKPVGNELGKLEVRRGLRGGMEYLRKFQKEQGLEGVPEATPALHMLDVLGASRPEVYRNVFEDLRTQLEDRIDKCTNDSQLEKLLSNSFTFMGMPELKAIPERIIIKLKTLPSKFLARLIKKPHLLDGLPLAIRQQAWEANTHMFRAAIGDLFKQYANNRVCVVIPAYDVNASQVVNKVNTHKRREDQKACLETLVQRINKEGTQLEPQAYQFLADKYHRKGDATYCTLLADLVILLATARSGKAGVLSRLTLFARCLDECVREGTMEARSLAQVLNHLRQIIKMCDERRLKHQQQAAARQAAAAPPPSAPRPGVDLSKVPTLDKALKDSIAFLARQDSGEIFQRSVIADYPALKDAYLSVVKTPMDMGLMRNRLRISYYRTFAAFDHDAQLIFQNCMAFNPAESDYYVIAKNQLTAWNSWKTRFKDVDYKVEVKAGKGGPKGGNASSASKSSSSSRPAPLIVDEPPKDPHLPKPLRVRDGIEGDPFRHALAILADPFVVQLLCRTIFRKLGEVGKSQSLPRDHAMLPSLVQLLAMALTARQQLDAKLSYQGYSIPSEAVTDEMLRSIMPCYLELTTFNKIMNKYGVAGWDNQPHDKEELQERLKGCIDRLYRLCKKQALQSPLVIRFLQQALVDSTAMVEDARTDNLAEMLKRLYVHCRKKADTAEGPPSSSSSDPSSWYRPEPHDRFLWASLATAAIHRAQSKGDDDDEEEEEQEQEEQEEQEQEEGEANKRAGRQATVPLEKELRDRLLDLYGQELPHTRGQPLTSWLHEQFVRLIREWAAKGVLQPADVLHHLTTKVLDVEGPLRRVWDEPNFEPHRAEYEKLFATQEGLREVMMGPPEEEDEGRGKASGGGEEDEGGGAKEEEEEMDEG